MKMQQRSLKSNVANTIHRSSSCEELPFCKKSYEYTHGSSCSYKSTDDLPASVAECFQDTSIMGKIQTSFLFLIGRGSRYKITTTSGCSLLSLLSQRMKQDRSIAPCYSVEDSNPLVPISVPCKLPVKQANSLPIKPKVTLSPNSEKKKLNNDSPLDVGDGSKYSCISKEERLSIKEEEDALLRQYMSLRQLAIARRHCNQLRRIRDSLVGRARPKVKCIPPTKEQEQLRNFLLDVGFVQYYTLLNRHGYDFETASHMDALDLAAVGITEPLHRMALKYELDQVRQPIGPSEEIPETIQEWLESISLPEYTEHFKQNEIFCPLAAVGLTKRDLQLMGIYMLGHRKKIILALASINMCLLRKDSVIKKKS